MNLRDKILEVCGETALWIPHGGDPVNVWVQRIESVVSPCGSLAFDVFTDTLIMRYSSSIYIDDISLCPDGSLAVCLKGLEDENSDLILTLR